MKKNSKSIDEGMTEAANALEQMLSGTAPEPKETSFSKDERMAKLASEGKLRPNRKKWPKEKLFAVIDDMAAWFLRHPDRFTMVEYFSDPDTQKDVSYAQLRNAMRYREDLREYHESLMEMLAARIASMALRGAIDAQFSKYYLSSRFAGWAEKSRVTSDVTVTTKVVDFKWNDAVEPPGDADDSE